MNAIGDWARSIRAMKSWALGALASLFVCAPVGAQLKPGGVGTATPGGLVPQGPNVLLIVGDEMGVDVVGAYGEHPTPAHTPVLNQLAADGVLFRNAWVQPGCSPTRAAILTGRQPWRTGVGMAVSFLGTTYELSPDEVSLADVLRARGYRTAAVGKWHLASASLSGAVQPLLLGFERHLGSYANLSEVGGGDYFSYPKLVDGVETPNRGYATSEQVDDALALIQGWGPQPWFLWLAFNAGHSPYHKPPEGLHTQDLPLPVEQSKPQHFRAMVEAMDTEIGRLLAGIPKPVLDDTVIIFVGDNGTPEDVTLPPFFTDHGKGSLFEGGVNVPLIIAGRGVARGAECSGLVVGPDLFRTVTELCGADGSSGLDGVSLVPYLTDPGQPSLRPYAFSQKFKPNGPGPLYPVDQRAVRGERYKIVATFNGCASPQSFAFYDLLKDPFEQRNLLLTGLDPDEQQAYQQMVAELQAVQPW